MEPQQKPARTTQPIHPTLEERWSSLAFSPESIPAEQLVALFEAARWSASCYNEQPWRFLVARNSDEAEFARMLDCLVPANRAWAQNAPVVGITLASLEFARNGKPNRWAYFDAGAAMAQLTVQATHFGLRVHQMGGFDVDKARELYAIPEGWDSIAAFAIGRPGDPQTLSADLQEREKAPRERRPLGEILFGGSFGQALDLDG